jgi:hypothetical protein
VVCADYPSDAFVHLRNLAQVPGAGVPRPASAPCALSSSPSPGSRWKTCSSRGRERVGAENPVQMCHAAAGTRAGVRMISVPSDRNTSSKFVVNFVSLFPDEEAHRPGFMGEQRG